MPKIDIPDGLLNPSELNQLQSAINTAVSEKRRTGVMTMARFMSIIKNVCQRIWDKISGFFSTLWDDICDIFDDICDIFS